MILRRANGLLNALVLLAVMFVAGVPDTASAHADDHAPSRSAALHEARDSPVHQPDEEGAGHCHPGLDCFTAAVFILAVDITPPEFVTTTAYLTPFHMVDDVRPDMDLPPPRRHS